MGRLSFKVIINLLGRVVLPSIFAVSLFDVYKQMFNKLE